VISRRSKPLVAAASVEGASVTAAALSSKCPTLSTMGAGTALRVRADSSS
jgi:hypothetical protein